MISRARENLVEGRLVGLEVVSRIVKRHAAVGQEALRLPVIKAEYLTDLAMREPSSTITLDHGIFDDVLSDSIRCITPLGSQVIGHMNRHSHD